MCAAWRVRRTAHVGHLVTAREDAVQRMHLAVEDVLVTLRDDRLSVIGPANGMVIREHDGSASGVMRMGTREAMRIALDALVSDGYVKTPSREAILAVLSSDDVHVRYALDWVIDAEMAADAILALLAGETS